MRPDSVDPASLRDQLRKLPAELSPPLSWDEFQRRASMQAADKNSRWRYAAMAAGVTALIVGSALWIRLESNNIPLAGPLAELPMTTLPNPRFAERAAVTERWLASLPSQPVVVRVGTHTAVAELEDRIAWMDDALNSERLNAVDPAHVAAIQDQRAQLVYSLAQVRYAESLVAAVR